MLPGSGQIWQDDFVFNQDDEAIDYEGWFQLDWNQNDISNATFTTNTNNTYHGPFIGDSNGDSNDVEINTLTRCFYCPSDSIVNVNYDYIFGCTGNSDYTALKINDKVIFNESMGTAGQVSFTVFSDGNLESDSLNAQNCDPPAIYKKQLGGISKSTLARDELIKIEIDIAMHNDQQASYITNIEISCNNATFSLQWIQQSILRIILQLILQIIQP